VEQAEIRDALKDIYKRFFDTSREIEHPIATALAIANRNVESFGDESLQQGLERCSVSRVNLAEAIRAVRKRLCCERGCLCEQEAIIGSLLGARCLCDGCLVWRLFA
jgi:hypothetical protein